MISISDAAQQVQQFENGNLGQQIALLEQKLLGANKFSCERYFDEMHITPPLLNSAFAIKRLAGQINVIVHAVGIMLSLPYILQEGEIIQCLSLGAGNTGKPFDLETNFRIAEFKFTHWRGGPESIRENQIFKDFYLLAEYDSTKDKTLYVVDDKYPLKFFDSGRSLSSIMSRNNKLWNEFQSRYGNRFSTVRDYYDFRKSNVRLSDLTKIIPELPDGLGYDILDEAIGEAE